MNTAVIITMIICGTIVTLSLINAVTSNAREKRAEKIHQLDETFLKMFEDK